MMPQHPSYNGYVYLIGSSKFGWYKIGCSRTAEVRIKQLGILLPFKIEVLCVWGTDNPKRLESEMHAMYAESHLNGEWFSFDWSGLSRVIFDPLPYFGQKVFSQELASVYRFSNMEQDRVKDHSDKKQRAIRHQALWAAMCEIMDERGLERTKENRSAVRKEIMLSQRKELMLLSKARKNIQVRPGR
jgi:hypothetical protein